MKLVSLRYALVLGVLCAAFGSAAGAASAEPLGHVFPALDSAASNADYSGTPHRDDYVILQSWETQKLHELKADNPDLEVLVYKDLAFSGPGAGAGSASGVSTSEAPESWFLKNTGGKKFTSEAYDWLWAMDVGSAAYQQRWAENVIGEVEAQGWDGVFIDDANTSMKYAYDPSQVAKYPTDAAYSAAMEAALAYIGPKVQAHGKLAIANFAQWVEAPQTYDRWLGYVSGALDEMFVKWGRNAGEGYRDAGQWQDQVEEAEYAAAAGKVFIAFTQGAVGETQAARYGYASVLLGGDSHASYAFTPNYTEETWLPEYEYEIGNPIGPATAEAGGVHRRQFEAGLVLVNPTGATRSVDFGGTYSGSGLEAATGASMPAHSALVLTGTAAGAGSGGGAPEGGAPEGGLLEGGAPAAPTAPSPSVSPVARPIEVTVTVGASTAGLRWSAPRGSGAVVYKVVKNKKQIATTRRRHHRVAGIARKRASRLRIVGYDRRGKLVARSKTFKVRGAGPGQSKSRSYKVR